MEMIEAYNHDRASYQAEITIRHKSHTSNQQKTGRSVTITFDFHSQDRTYYTKLQEASEAKFFEILRENTNLQDGDNSIL
jgi:hypothetical protein